jgi:hypothetical protein
MACSDSKLTSQLRDGLAPNAAFLLVVAVDPIASPESLVLAALQAASRIHNAGLGAPRVEKPRDLTAHVLKLCSKRMSQDLQQRMFAAWVSVRARRVAYTHKVLWLWRFRQGRLRGLAFSEWRAATALNRVVTSLWHGHVQRAHFGWWREVLTMRRRLLQVLARLWFRVTSQVWSRWRTHTATRKQIYARARRVAGRMRHSALRALLINWVYALKQAQSGRSISALAWSRLLRQRLGAAFGRWCARRQQVSERFSVIPLQDWLFTPELQWQSRGKWRILQECNGKRSG